MRVLLISHTCQSASEGLPKAHALAQIAGLDLRVLVPDRWMHYGRWRKPDLPMDPLFAHEVGRTALPWVGPAQFYLHCYPQLNRTLLDFRPDIIDLWEEPWSLVSAQACWLRNRMLPHTKIISETEQNLNKHLPAPFSWFRRYSLGNANFAVARSTEALQVLRARGYRGAAQVVPNAVDANLFRPLDRARCRDQLGVKGFVVGYVGRMVPEKGVSDLVDAIAMCPAHVNLVCVGEGPATSELKRRAWKMGISDRVRLLAQVPAHDLPQVMNAFDCLALPSHTTARWKEQFGRVIVEAQACGTPVIGSSSGAIPEVVGEGGLTFPEGDPAAIAAAICRLDTYGENRKALAEKGRRQVLDRFAWDRVARQMNQIYSDLLKPCGETAQLQTVTHRDDVAA